MRGRDVATSTGTIADLISYGQCLLSQAGIQNSHQEVLWLLQAALNHSSLHLQLEGDRFLTLEEWERGLEQLARRGNREPLQYILGTQEFYGLEFEVGPSVLIPRPETTLLVETALQQSAELSNPVIIDMGTGSGCVAITLASMVPHATIYATDLSPQALMVAMRNARHHGVEHRIVFLEGDMFEPLQGNPEGGVVPIIVSNPPYIAQSDWEALQPEIRTYEPAMALDGGSNGLAILRRLLSEAPAWLENKGWLNLEVGQGQAEHVMAMAEETALYSTIRSWPDEAGIDRVVSLQKK